MNRNWNSLMPDPIGAHQSRLLGSRSESAQLKVQK